MVSRFASLIVFCFIVIFWKTAQIQIAGKICLGQSFFKLKSSKSTLMGHLESDTESIDLSQVHLDVTLAVHSPCTTSGVGYKNYTITPIPYKLYANINYRQTSHTSGIFPTNDE